VAGPDHRRRSAGSKLTGIARSADCGLVPVEAAAPPGRGKRPWHRVANPARLLISPRLASGVWASACLRRSAPRRAQASGCGWRQGGRRRCARGGVSMGGLGQEGSSELCLSTTPSAARTLNCGALADGRGPAAGIIFPQGRRDREAQQRGFGLWWMAWPDLAPRPSFSACRPDQLEACRRAASACSRTRVSAEILVVVMRGTRTAGFWPRAGGCRRRLLSGRQLAGE